MRKNWRERWRNRLNRPLFSGTGFLAGILLWWGCAADLRAQTLASPREPAGTFDYSSYAEVLRSFVSEAGLVDYAALAQRREPLDRFVSQLAAVDPRQLEQSPKPAQLAFWINAYNALTLRVVLDHYPIRAGFFRSLLYPANSIRQIPGVWDEIRFTVAGRERTLDEIEHQILRRRFHEPRIHFALVCAALGCPPLRREPYEERRLEEQLDDQVRRFLTDPRKFQWDEERRMLRISPIFRWFEEDFSGACPEGGGGRSAVLCFLQRYLPASQRRLLSSSSLRIEYLDYDWSLNDQSSGAP